MFNIAIDGPAGAGKSSIAKIVSKKLGFVYIDTGAMFRAMAYFLVSHGIDPGEEVAVISVLDDMDISLEYEDGTQLIFLNGKNVSDAIRTSSIGNVASIISTYPKVREKLLYLQRELASKENVVMDGRDIGSTVLVHADLKIFLTADSAVRAKRRFDEMCEKNPGQIFDRAQIEKEIIERDTRDMHRAHAPLVQVSDAILVDSSNMSIEEVVDTIFALAKERLV